MAITITSIPALKDNYIWLIKNANNNSAIVIDPGEADPVLKALQQQKLHLNAILLTHHHWDHTNGVAELLQHFSVPVYASQDETLAVATVRVAEGDQLTLDAVGITLTVISIPAHTKGHIAYYGEQAVFSGDTLFTGGCGRIFEGTAEQMFHSLEKLAALPGDTRVFCGHEYTLDNLRFAAMVEPANLVLQQRIQETQALRQQHSPTVPSTIALELATNPFLRCHIPAVKLAAEQHARCPLANSIEVFTILREWKNGFK